MRVVLRVWFAATALFLAGALIWAFVPVLVPLLALAAGLGGVVALIVSAARWLERKRGRDAPPA